jgi:hypothetical protein
MLNTSLKSKDFFFSIYTMDHLNQGKYLKLDNFKIVNNIIQNSAKLRLNHSFILLNKTLYRYILVIYGIDIIIYPFAPIF